MGKESTCNVGDPGLIPGLGRYPGERKGYPLQYSGLENSKDYIHRQGQTRLSDFHFHFSVAERCRSQNIWTSFPSVITLLRFLVFLDLKGVKYLIWLQCGRNKYINWCIRLFFHSVYVSSFSLIDFFLSFLGSNSMGIAIYSKTSPKLLYVKHNLIAIFILIMDNFLFGSNT